MSHGTFSALKYGKLGASKAHPYHGLWQHTHGDLLDNLRLASLFLDFAPKRAILESPQTQTF